MTYDEVLNELTALYRGCYASYTNAEQSHIEALYIEVTGRMMRQCRCRNKYNDAVIELICYLKKHGKMKEKQNYILRPGVLLEHTDGNVYTNDNLTDSVAIQFLKDKPKAAWMFITTPSNEAQSNKTPPDGTQTLHARIAELEAMNSDLVTRIAELEAMNTGATPEINESVNAQEGGEADSVDDDKVGGKAIEINEQIKALIAGKLAEGKSTEAIKTSLSGTIIEGVKLNKSVVGIYIKAIKAEA